MRSVIKGITRGIVRSDSTGDPDVLAYLEALADAGESPTAPQIAAIETFVATGKDEGWYSEIKRFYLPIWAAALPNSLCMVSGTNGTFVGTVTHAAGYIVGDGLTGYFRTDARVNTLASTEDVLFGALTKTVQTGSNNYSLGTGSTGGTSIRLGSESSPNLPIAIFPGVVKKLGVIGTDGVTHGARSGGSTFCGNKKGNASYAEGFTTGALTGGFSDFLVAIMATGTSDSNASNYSGAEHGAAYIATGMNATKRSQLASAVENLWEGVSGLTLS